MRNAFCAFFAAMTVVTLPVIGQTTIDKHTDPFSVQPLTVDSETTPDQDQSSGPNIIGGIRDAQLI